MRFETSSAKDALIFNGKGAHVVNPWRIEVDTDAEIISVKKRNWHMIGTDDQTVAFKRIRSITIDEHFVGADIHIKVVGGGVIGILLVEIGCPKNQGNFVSLQ